MIAITKKHNVSVLDFEKRGIRTPFCFSQDVPGPAEIQ